MAGIITYDNIVIQQGQCLMDIALQYYGTADPQALIALVQDNALDSVTTKLTAGQTLQIRNNAEFSNTKIANYYRANNINPATATNELINLIATASHYAGTWNSDNNILSFIAGYGAEEIAITLKEVLSANTYCRFIVSSNNPINGTINWGGSIYPLNVNTNEQVTLTVVASLEINNNITLNLGYLNPGITYNLKLIITKA